MENLLTKQEMMIIALSDDNQRLYKCSEHGVFSKHKDSDNFNCPYSCNGKKVSEMWYNASTDLTEVKNRFRKELGLKS